MFSRQKQITPGIWPTEPRVQRELVAHCVNLNTALATPQSFLLGNIHVIAGDSSLGHGPVEAFNHTVWDQSRQKQPASAGWEVA